MSNLILDYNTLPDSKDDILDDVYESVKQNNYLEQIKIDNRYLYQYYLNPNRENILNVCDINNNDYCLEIGAECGAISSGILKKCNHLDSVEISKIKSEINHLKNNNDDFNIYVGDLERINLNKKYDKIFLIGSLELAKLYFPNSDNPYVSMIKKIKSLLNANGILYLAINNKYGMKYFSGASDDLEGTYFNNIEGKKYSFSYNELKKLLNENGFKKLYFYYPLPDYKFSEEIYSEDFIPDHYLNILGHSYDKDRYKLFDEAKAMKEACEKGDFGLFSNSFLVECKV